MRRKFVSAAFVCVIGVSLFWGGAGKSYAASPVLSPGSPDSVNMLQKPLNEIDSVIQQGITDKYMPGAVVLVAHQGKIVKEDAYGYAARYLDADYTEMDHPVKMQKNTMFDLASITKVFTATAAMQLYEKGKLKLDAPVSSYIPEFAQNGKSGVTIRQLLTHTSGFSAWLPLYKTTNSREDAYQTVFSTALEYEPGTHYVYSDLNMITLGALVEKITGKRLDQYIKEHITDPLGMKDTMFNPPNSLKERTAATEFQPWTNRGVVWGEVHDENAWLMDGVSGHAGLFSTADDLAIFAQMMLNSGEYKGTRILDADTIKMIETNQLPDFPGDDHGLGWELNQAWYMGALADPATMGHTGFTGTSIVISPDKQTTVILLTNKVHPTREAPSTNPIRQQVANKTADAINAWSATSMKALVGQLEKEDAVKSSAAAHILNMHLTAVSHYEQKNMADKVIKHMEGFKTLVEHQKNEDLLSDDAYQTLKRDADYLIGKWQ
jgi:CubicO group peptidase (beta-lactamase class C family)